MDWVKLPNYFFLKKIIGFTTKTTVTGSTRITNLPFKMSSRLPSNSPKDCYATCRAAIPVFSKEWSLMLFNNYYAVWLCRVNSHILSSTRLPAPRPAGGVGALGLTLTEEGPLWFLRLVCWLGNWAAAGPCPVALARLRALAGALFAARFSPRPSCWLQWIFWSFPGVFCLLCPAAGGGTAAEIIRS